ncbi:MAG: serine/threonine-protein kinase [Myxococcota bacterium]
MLEPGELIDGKYLVQRLIGRGGMGAVYEGRHTLVERRVAIKVVFDEVAASDSGASRFEREVRAAGRIGNDHILEIYDVGALPNGTRYMVSEFLDGEALSARLARQGPLPPQVIGHLMLQLLTGLAAAHHVGILHRDLKPDNIFLVREKAGKVDFVKIIDFGISKFQPLSGTSDAMKMTATGVVVGTPYYLSPEQARGLKDIDARSDLYAVGVIMYECATGRVPFHAESFNQLLFKIALEEPAPLETLVPGIDPWFVGLVQKAMARDPAHRFQSALEMRDEIARWLGLSQSSANRAVQPGFDATLMADANFTPQPAQRSRVPTPSSFGRTSDPEQTDLLAPSRSSFKKVALIGTPLLLVIAGSVFFIKSHLDDSGATAAASSSAAPTASAPSSVAAAKTAPEPAVEPAPPVVVPPPDAPEVSLSPAPAASPRPTAALVSPSRPPARPPRTNGAAPRSEPARKDPPAATAPPPKPEPEARPAPAPTPRPPSRDFGY